MGKRSDILQGTLDMLVLKILSVHAHLHGYAITAEVHGVSAGLLRVEEGSLYPALHRMEQEGLIRSEWGITEKKREARFYSLTPKGRKHLAQEAEDWERLTKGVARVLRLGHGVA